MPLTVTVPPVPPDYYAFKAFYRMWAKKARWFRMWSEITQQSQEEAAGFPTYDTWLYITHIGQHGGSSPPRKEEAAAEAFDVSRTFYLERQARLCAEKARRVARYAEIADSGVDVKRRQESERVRFVLQEMGDSDYSEYDSDGRNSGLAARVKREAVFVKSRASYDDGYTLRAVYKGSAATTRDQLARYCASLRDSDSVSDSDSDNDYDISFGGLRIARCDQ